MSSCVSIAPVVGALLVGRAARLQMEKEETERAGFNSGKECVANSPGAAIREMHSIQLSHPKLRKTWGIAIQAGLCLE